ncbi:hypothetical protein [Bogoriella caseilytica]|uniref:Uncharacterized protein n=1 Tax=Bogoriella caseilytica TaxID=56055 RepID=A0A3N2BB79_9MICO|nr:hypothetical protein [Bogoriella caseilytica]ROR72510.1 hypothetical protein EDD31_0862 [Bogoriella caseilytica]
MTPASLLLAARIAAILTLAFVGVLFVSAGLLVQEARGLDVHGIGAIAIHVSSGLLAALLTVRAWRTGSGRTAAGVAIVLFGATFAQAALGDYLTLALHVVGALVVTVLATGLAVWAFTSPNRTAAATQ